MTHVMVDLETLGVVPGCMIVSIGAVVFGNVLGKEFYQPIHVGAEGSRFGLHSSKQTEEWWAKQSPEARAVFTDPRCMRLDKALAAFNDWLPIDAVVWGNGADFDNSIMAAAYYATMIKPGWKPYNSRCYRTIKNLAPSIVMKRGGTHHNALDDAKSQAIHLLEVANTLRLILS